MAKEKKRYNFIHRPLGLRIAGCMIVILLAASVCAYGCFYIILKGPYKSYRADFVKHVCNETRFGFVVEYIIGSDETQAVLGPASDETADGDPKEGEAKE